MTTVPSSHDLLDRLRMNTSDAHVRIEHQPRLRMLLSRELVLQNYVTLLRDLACWYDALDEQILLRLRALPEHSYCWLPRSTWLAEDLRDLDATDLAKENVLKPKLPSMQNLDELVGVIYVMEGATQGGRVIAPLLEQRLGLTAQNGAHYFNAWQHGGWETFRAWAETFRFDLDAATRTANQTFATLHRFLDQTSRSCLRAERIA